MQAVEESMIDDLRALDDPMLQCSYLIECGRSLPPMDESLKTGESLVKECEVDTWFAIVREPDGTRRLAADSSSLIVRGALALVTEVLDAGSGDEWVAHEWRLLSEPAFARNFNQVQLRGLRAVLSRLRGCGASGDAALTRHPGMPNVSTLLS